MTLTYLYGPKICGRLDMMSQKNKRRKRRAKQNDKNDKYNNNFAIDASTMNL